MNVLVVGLGSIAKKHVTALKELMPDVTIYALRSAAANEVFENVINIRQYDELPAKPGFVIIANPTSLHRQTILDAIELGCPLFIEKPVLANVYDAEMITSLLRERGIITYIACNLRFHPVINFVKQELAKNDMRINEVNVYCGSYLPGWRPQQDYTRSYSASATMGGGVHLDLIHEIDYAYWLFGKPADVVSVKRKTSSLQIDSCDFAAFHLLYPHFTVNIVLNYYRRNAKRTLEVVTETGMLHADLLTATVTDETGKVLYSNKDYSMAATYAEQLKYFTDHIINQQQPMNGFSEAVEVLKIVTSEQASK